jgi:hypothetical protein
MRLIVCGGRDYRDRDRLCAVLDQHAPTEIATGGASGADSLAVDWAWKRGIPAKIFIPDWAAHGLAAGPLRNQRMLDEFKPDAVIAFPGGRGTADMVRRARAAGVHVAEVLDGGGE